MSDEVTQTGCSIAYGLSVSHTDRQIGMMEIADIIHTLEIVWTTYVSSLTMLFLWDSEGHLMGLMVRGP